MNIILIMGVPGSGKSTFLKKLKKEGAFVLNDDDLRESVFGFERTYDIREKLYLLYIDILIDTLKNKKFGKVFLDTTFFNTKEMRENLFLQIYQNEVPNIKINVIYMRSQLSDCLLRNKKRKPNRIVEESKLILFYERLQPPSISERYINTIIEVS